MRGQSHLQLGKYLVDRYMHTVPGRCKRAFLIGCIQPDRNPATYFKGSVRHQWMRGHNYPNTRRFMLRLSIRLERKAKFTIFDYYLLGKLIHYTADAFTLAHNSRFPTNLSLHRIYETQLQEYFLAYLKQNPEVNLRMKQTIMETIRNAHQEYSRQKPHIHMDTTYVLTVSCSVLAILFDQQ